MASKESIKKKEEAVVKLAAKMKESKSIILTHFNGLSVANTNELRNQLKEENIAMEVVKNNITKRALESNDYKELCELVTSGVAVVTSKDDATAAARILKKFTVKHDALKLLGGTIDHEIMDIDSINEIADLPSKDGLISMLLSVLNAPVRDLAIVTSEVAKTKPADDVKVEEVKAEEPKVEEAKAEEPKVEEAKAEEPKVEEAKAEEPKVEEAKAEEPKVEEAKKEEEKTE